VGFANLGASLAIVCQKKAYIGIFIWLLKWKRKAKRKIALNPRGMFALGASRSGTNWSIIIYIDAKNGMPSRIELSAGKGDSLKGVVES